MCLTDFEDRYELGEVDGQLEKIKEQFELVEEYDWEEVQHIIFLVIDGVGDAVRGVGIAGEIDVALDVHVGSGAAIAAGG